MKPDLKDVLFLVYSCKSYKKKLDAVHQTWGSRLPSVKYVLDFEPANIPNVLYIPITGVKKLGVKTIHMWKEVFRLYGKQYQWFVKIDDDCYLWPDRLVNYLAQYDSSEPIYLGNTSHYNYKNWAAGFAYILSSKALEELVPAFDVPAARQLNAQRTSEEDVVVGNTLEVRGYLPKDVPGIVPIPNWEAIQKRECIIVSGLSAPRLRLMDWVARIDKGWITQATASALDLYRILHSKFMSYRRSE